jgi:peptidyl-prolyl cis-trans isomerase A (cyclophilin A)
MRLLRASATSTLVLLCALTACESREPTFEPQPSRENLPGSSPLFHPPLPRPQPLAAPVAPPAGPVDARLLPEGDGLPARSPDRYAVRLETTKGVVLIDVTRAWAPLGADRFYDLVRRGAYDDNAFFRAVSGFMVQVGIPGDPRVSAAWRSKYIPDDPPVEHNTRGTVTFATSGANQRVNQFFVNLVDNSRLDPMGFAPIGRVRDLTTIDALYTGYGETPAQARIQREGNAYLRVEYPLLDYIRTARIEP